jgi:nicotinic acid phosphoribosyltransferase
MQLLPFDVEREVRAILPRPEASDWAFLAKHGYALGGGVQAALEAASTVRVVGLPQFSWFFEREPIFSVTGPSAAVSWLEPLALTWNYRIQVATAAVLRPETLPAEVGTVTCERQRALVLETLDAVGVASPPIVVAPEAYVERVRARIRPLVEATGSSDRLFEVGLRAATCLEQHLLALEACKAEGLLRTSNVWGANRLAMTPVGTMGHEHVQRYGSDEAAFRAMVERRAQRSSFLLDTFDTIRSGIPTAFRLMQRRPHQGDSIRYDSGDKEAQYRFAVQLANELGLQPVHILEDGFDLEQTQRFEAIRRELGVPASLQVYGYGGAVVAQTSGSSFTRDRVSAVYKLSQTGDRACMKFGNEPNSGKQSIPGRPVVWRRRKAEGPWGIIGQEGEKPVDGYELVSGGRAEGSVAQPTERGFPRVELSSQTQAMVEALKAEASAQMSRWS